MDVPPSSDTRGKKDVALNAKTNAANTHTDLVAFRELVLFERRHALGCKEHCYRHFDVLAAGRTLSSPVQSKLAVSFHNHFTPLPPSRPRPTARVIHCWRFSDTLSEIFVHVICLVRTYKGNEHIWMLLFPSVEPSGSQPARSTARHRKDIYHMHTTLSALLRSLIIAMLELLLLL